MIDRNLVAKIADHAIEAYQSCGLIDIEAAKTEAVLATVDKFTPDEPSTDDIEAEIDAIDAMYFSQNARQAVVHYYREGWAKERIAWRKHLEANSR